MLDSLALGDNEMHKCLADTLELSFPVCSSIKDPQKPFLFQLYLFAACLIINKNKWTKPV